MEEYLKTVMEQIRCEKVHPFVERELRDHMEDQIAENLAAGMSQEEAVTEAVKDMGDPVETGIFLDQVHRPQTAWGMILLVGVLSLFGIFLHGQIASLGNGAEALRSGRAIISVIVGFLLMMVIYRLDYIVLARYSKWIAALLLGLGLYCRFFGVQINGACRWVMFLGVPINVEVVTLLYVPVFAGIIYKYRNSNWLGLLKAVLWMVAALFLLLEMPALTTVLIMLISMLMLLTIAICKGWFRIWKPLGIAALWGVFFGLPTGVILFKFFHNGMADYIRYRILAFFGGNENVNYYTDMLRSNVAFSKFSGANGLDMTERLSNYNSDYLFNYVLGSYGIFLGLLIAAGLGLLIIWIFQISLKQKNQLGMLVGAAVGMVLAMITLMNFGVNLGWLPNTSTFLPLFSAGTGDLWIVYVLLGLVLSIYRFKSIYPKHVNLAISFPGKRQEVKNE